MPSIDTLCSEFSEVADRVNRTLNTMMSTVANGYVPSKSSVKSLEKNINELQRKYNSIRDLARTEANEGQFCNGLPIDEYADIVRNSAAARMEALIAEAELLLKQFISVKSSMKAFGDALLPYQSSAEIQLDELDNSEEYESLPEKIVPLRFFLEALEVEDFNSDAGLELMEKIEDYYSSKVQRGLMLKKYYLPDDMIIKKIEKTEEKNQSEAVAETEEHLQKQEPEINSKESKSEAEPDKISDTAEQAPVQEQEISAEESAGIKAEPPKPAKPVKMVLAKNKIKKGTPSASKFKEMLIQLPPETVAILPYFTHFGVLSAEQVVQFCICLGCPLSTDDAKEIVRQSVCQLASKGILAEYDIESVEGSVYCLSQYGYASLMKKTICVNLSSLFPLPVGKYCFTGSSEMDEDKLANAYAHSFMALRYMECGNKVYCAEAAPNSMSCDIRWQGSCFYADVFYKDEKYWCALISLSDFNEENIASDTLIMLPDGADLPVLQKNPEFKVFAFTADKLYLRTGNAWEDITASAKDKNAEETENSKDEDANAVAPKKAAPARSRKGLPPAKAKPAAAKKPTVASIPTASAANNQVKNKSNDSKPATEKAKSQLDERPIENAAEKPVEDNLVEQMCNDLLDSSIPPTDSEFKDLVCCMLRGNASEINILNALLVAEAASFDSGNLVMQSLYKQLELALNVKRTNSAYTGENMVSAFHDDYEITESCKLAAFAYGMAFPGQAYDHTLRAYTQALTDGFDEIFPSYAALKPLFHILSEVFEVSPEGFSDSILNALSDHDRSSVYIEKLKKQAAQLLDEPSVKAHIKGIPELSDALFGKKSDLYYCLSAVAADNKAELGSAIAVLTDYCESYASSFVLSEEAQEQKIDEEWKNATRAARGKNSRPLSLEYSARKQVAEALRQRLEVVKAWVDFNSDKPTTNIGELRNVKNKIVEEIGRAAADVRDESKCKYKGIVLRMLDTVKAKLTDTEPVGLAYHELLQTGIISLDNDGFPILDSSLHTVKYAEPWRDVLKHIAAPKVSLEQITKEIFDNSSLVFDNLHQLEMIGRHLSSDDEIYTVSSTQLEEAIETANEAAEHFHDDLELAYTYNRLYEAEKETLSALVDNYQEQFYTRKDFGSWRQFLRNLKRQMQDISIQRMYDLDMRFEKCKAQLAPGETSPLLSMAQRLLRVDQNYAVAEEYFNRFESGERSLSEELNAALNGGDSFSEFISDDVFSPLYDECFRKSGTSFVRFSTAYVSGRFPEDWTSRHKDDSRKFLSNWPTGRGNTTPGQIAAFISGIGFNVRGATLDNTHRQEVYKLDVEPTPRNKPDYRHPIAALGTQIKSPLNVVVLYGKSMAQELVDTMTALNLGGMSIVLIDYPLDRSVRRQIAEIFHTKTSGQNPFLIIDQVLALHLAMHQDTERMPLFLKCTLPYTYYQPFVRDGGSTADEMFCGRTTELATILDPNGACVVYGVRQLGKTALLERAESLFAKPESKTYSAYCSILKMSSEAEVVHRLVEAINKETPLNLSACSTLKTLCGQIDAMFRNGTVASMLLLIDESDDFLKSISEKEYKPLLPLVDLKRESKNRFKFVLAGLHNVCRAKNATENNGIFGQLGQPLCVKPLSPTDALQLISRPLRYLGFQVDRYPHLETILTNTNYYPGILQFFGYTLVQTMSSQYGKYYRAVDGNPPYTLQKEQLGAILNSADLNSSIKEKFRWTLNLDPRYFMLARCIANLYYENAGNLEADQAGYTAEQISKTAAEFDIHCLEKETPQSTAVLLDEMTDMGILSRPNETAQRYRLRRKSFINIIAPDIDTLWNDIMACNEEAL